MSHTHTCRVYVWLSAKNDVYRGVIGNIAVEYANYLITG